MIWVRLLLSVILIMFDSCAQNNVEASGAVEDEGLAPGGAEAGAGSTEPPWPLVGSHRVNVDSLFFFILSRPPSGLHIPACPFFAGFGASGSDFFNIFFS